MPNVIIKGIDRPFGGGVESILIRSLLVNWKLGYFFYLILKGLLHKISKKTFRRRLTLILAARAGKKLPFT
jgi:hypothetical protein